MIVEGELLASVVDDEEVDGRLLEADTVVCAVVVEP